MALFGAGGEQFGGLLDHGVEVQRLSVESVGANAQHVLPHLLRVDARHGDHRRHADGGVRADARAEAAPVDARQVEVQEHQGGMALGDDPARLEAVEGLGHAYIGEFPLQHALEDRVEVVIVVDDQDEPRVHLGVHFYIEFGRSPHAPLVEEGDQVLGVDAELASRRGKGLEVACLYPIDGRLIHHAAEVRDLEGGEYADPFFVPSHFLTERPEGPFQSIEYASGKV